MDSLQDGAVRVETLAGLSRFRRELYECLTLRADALFELMDAVLCAEGPVTSLPELSLSGVHRRGHGAMYDALAQGHINASRLRMALAGLRLPRGTDGQISIALDVTAWPRPDAECSPARLHCHRPCRCDGVRQTIPGWPYQVAAALGGGRSSWTGPLDAVRLGPEDDPTEVTAAQIRDLVARLERAGQWRPGDLPVLFVLDSGYDIVRLTWLLREEPVRLLGRIRADRVMRAPALQAPRNEPRAPAPTWSGVPPGPGHDLSGAGPGVGSTSTTASVKSSPAAGAACTPSWTGAAPGLTTKANSPSSRERWSIWRSSTCPAIATPGRYGCGTATPMPPRTTSTASGGSSFEGSISSTLSASSSRRSA